MIELSRSTSLTLPVTIGQIRLHHITPGLGQDILRFALRLINSLCQIATSFLALGKYIRWSFFYSLHQSLTHQVNLLTKNKYVTTISRAECQTTRNSRQSRRVSIPFGLPLRIPTVNHTQYYICLDVPHLAPHHHHSCVPGQRGSEKENLALAPAIRFQSSVSPPFVCFIVTLAHNSRELHSILLLPCHFCSNQTHLPTMYLTVELLLQYRRLLAVPSLEFILCSFTTLFDLAGLLKKPIHTSGSPLPTLQVIICRLATFP